MKFGILDNSRIFVLNLAKESKHNTSKEYFLCSLVSYFLNRIRLSNPCGCSYLYVYGSLARIREAIAFHIFKNSNFIAMPKDLKFANDAQGADNARTSPRKREIPSLSLKRQLKHLKTMIRTERNHKLRAYSFILDNSIFDCYSHYCMTTLPDSIPDEFIEIMDIMSLKTDPTLLKQGGIQ